MGKKPVFVQPKAGSPLAQAMSIPWISAGIMPEVKDDGFGSMESGRLLVWVKDYGPEFGRLLQYPSGKLKWLITGYLGDFEVTHWAYLTKPK